MKKLTPFLLVALVGAFFSCGTTREACDETSDKSSAPEATFREAFTAMQERQDRVQSIRATWNAVGLVYWRGEPRGDFPHQRWKPARVPRVLHPSLWVRNSSLRYEDPVESVLHTPSRLHSKGTWTEQKARNTEGANWAEVEWFAADPYLPIILAYRPVNETIGPILSAPWKPVKKDTYRGYSCVVVRGTSFPDISRAPYYQVWLAKDRDYLPVHYEVRNEHAEVKEQGNMNYIRRNGKWVLGGWIRRVPAPGRGMKWRTARKATSLEITFNSPIKDKRFLDIDSEE